MIIVDFKQGQDGVKSQVLPNSLKVILTIMNSCSKKGQYNILKPISDAFAQSSAFGLLNCNLYCSYVPVYQMPD